ncbi:MAG: adenylate/guanylate cyclase domain-containing protein [Roseiarcus sp.]
MSETRKLAAILCSDVVGYSRLAGADEDRILARLRALRSDLIDPTIAVNRGRVVKRTGDGAIVEFRSVVDAVRCATEIQNAMIERNSGLPDDQRIVFRIGIHVGDVVEEADGDLMGDGVNIAARLEGVAKPGAICLSEQAYWQVKGRLDFAVTDLGPTRLKNIAEPVRAYSLQVGVPAGAKPASGAKRPEPKKRSAFAPLVAVIAALFVAITGGAWYFLVASRPVAVVASGPAIVATNTVATTPSAPLQAKHLSIVVLPFKNLSGDPAQDYFADGITENITTELSRIRNSFVISRETAFTFKGKGVDAREVGKELGVRYVLEGSVQRDQSRVRVNAQLIDAESGAHLGSDRFDEDIADLFKLQDQVVARLANTLGRELILAEAEKAARSKNPDAADLTMRGRALMMQTTSTKDAMNAALSLFDQALKIDPNDADALAEEAVAYKNEFFGWRNPAIDYDAKVIGQADRAITLDPGNARAYAAKSNFYTLTGRPNDALSVADAGLVVNPNYAGLYEMRADAEISLRRFEQAKSDLQRAMGLSPRDPGIGCWHVAWGMAELGLGHFDAAIDEYKKGVDLGCHVYYAYAGLAAAYAQEDRLFEARDALVEARRITPEITVKWMRHHIWNVPNFFDGVGKAGLPYE